MKSATSTVTTLQSHHWFGHRDEARIREVHRLIRVLAHQLPDTRATLAQVPRAQKHTLSFAR